MTTAWHTIDVVSQNTQSRRLSPSRPTGIGDWHKGAAFTNRVNYMAQTLTGLHPDVIVTQEQGDIKMARLQAAAYSKHLGGKYEVVILGGDTWDISQAIIVRTDVFDCRAVGQVALTPAGPGHSHNKVPYAVLDQHGSGMSIAIFVPHLIAGQSTANATARGKQGVSLMSQIDKARVGAPALIMGDFNQPIGSGDKVGRALKKRGYIDAENSPCAVKNPSYNTSNQLENPPVRHSSQIDRAAATPKDIEFTLRHIVLRLDKRGNHTTPFPADHQPLRVTARVKEAA